MSQLINVIAVVILCFSIFITAIINMQVSDRLEDIAVILKDR